MSDNDIKDLLRRSALSFVATVEHLGAATVSGVSIGDRTAVARVEYVLHAPPGFASIAGQRVTIELAVDQPVPAVNDSLTFFVEGVAFDESLVVREVGRLPVSAIMGRITGAANAQGEVFGPLLRQLETDRLREHAAGADAIVVARVAGLERAFGPVIYEHDPEWWKATLEVYFVKKGDITGNSVVALYPNSIDVRWRQAPKPKASQGGVWLLHATGDDLRAVAPYMLLHPEDFQPTQELDAIS